LKKQWVKQSSHPQQRNYTTVYVSLTADQARKLRDAAKKALTTESDVLSMSLVSESSDSSIH
jgi:hypothetical protein